MAERFQAANGVGLVVGSNEMQFAVGAFLPDLAGAERRIFLYRASE